MATYRCLSCEKTLEEPKCDCGSPPAGEIKYQKISTVHFVHPEQPGSPSLYCSKRRLVETDALTSCHPIGVTCPRCLFSLQEAYGNRGEAEKVEEPPNPDTIPTDDTSPESVPFFPEDLDAAPASPEKQ